jgi:hypothetical protein
VIAQPRADHHRVVQYVDLIIPLTGGGCEATEVISLFMTDSASDLQWLRRCVAVGGWST